MDRFYVPFSGFWKYIHLTNPWQDTGHWHHLGKFLHLQSIPFLKATSVLIFSSIDHFACYRSSCTWNCIVYSLLCKAFLFNLMFLRFAHAIACTNSLLFSVVGVVWMYQCWYFHFPIDGHLGYFQFLAIINKAVINILIQFFCRHMFFSWVSTWV